MNRQDRKDFFRKQAMKQYRGTIKDIQKTLRTIDLSKPTDAAMLLLATLPMVATSGKDHFNGGILYINMTKLSKLDPDERVKLLIKYTLHCASWMENRLGIRKEYKTHTWWSKSPKHGYYWG